MKRFRVFDQIAAHLPGLGHSVPSIPSGPALSPSWACSRFASIAAARDPCHALGVLLVFLAQICRGGASQVGIGVMHPELLGGFGLSSELHGLFSAVVPFACKLPPSTSELVKEVTSQLRSLVQKRTFSYDLFYGQHQSPWGVGMKPQFDVVVAMPIAEAIDVLHLCEGLGSAIVFEMRDEGVGSISLRVHYDSRRVPQGFVDEWICMLGNMGAQTGIQWPAAREEAMLLMPETAKLCEQAVANEREWNFNNTSKAFPKDVCLHDLVGIQALATPDAVALNWHGDELTYTRLIELSERVVAWLHAHGAGESPRHATPHYATPSLTRPHTPHHTTNPLFHFGIEQPAAFHFSSHANST